MHVWTSCLFLLLMFFMLFMFLVLLLVLIVNQLFGEYFASHHTMESNITESAGINKILLVLLGNLILQVEYLLFFGRAKLFSHFDEDQLLQLINIAQIHGHF